MADEIGSSGENPADDTGSIESSELGDAVDDAMDPVRHEAIMRAWQQIAMTHVDSAVPPRDDDLVQRLYEQQERGDEPPPA